MQIHQVDVIDGIPLGPWPAVVLLTNQTDAQLNGIYGLARFNGEQLYWDPGAVSVMPVVGIPRSKPPLTTLARCAGNDGTCSKWFRLAAADVGRVITCSDCGTRHRVESMGGEEVCLVGM